MLSTATFPLPPPLSGSRFGVFTLPNLAGCFLFNTASIKTGSLISLWKDMIKNLGGSSKQIKANHVHGGKQL